MALTEKSINYKNMLLELLKIPNGFGVSNLKNSSIIIILIIIGFANCTPSNPQWEITDFKKNGSNSPRRGSVCDKKECVENADLIRLYMDTSVDPCDNFYNFVCGNFTKNAEFLPGLPLADPFHAISEKIKQKLKYSVQNEINNHDPEVFQKIKSYFDLCMDESEIVKEGKRHLLGNLKRAGLKGWPVLETSIENPVYPQYYKKRATSVNQQIERSLASNSTNLQKKLKWITLDTSMDNWGNEFSSLSIQEHYPSEHTTQFPRQYPRQFSPQNPAAQGFPDYHYPNPAKSFDFDWVETAIIFSKNGFYFNSLINVEVIPNIQDNTKRTLIISPPSFIIPAEILANDKESLKKNIYLGFMINVANALGANNKLSELYETYNFQIHLAKLSYEAAKEAKGRAAITTIGLLQTYIPYIPWLKYLNGILSPYKRISIYDQVTITGLSYFERLGILLASPEITKTLANYAYWRAIETTISKWDLNLGQQQIEILLGSIKKQSRSSYCTDVVSRSLPLAVGALFVRKHFDKTTVQSVTDIFADLKNTFASTLQAADWMDETTRKQALNKLENIVPLIGYPSEHLNDQVLNEYHRKLVINPESYFVSSLNLNIFQHQKLVESLSRPVDKFDWTSEFGKSAQVNAFYYPPHNSMIFPASILQPPMFKVNNQKYMNYARLGYVVGHEMTHGFDSAGSQFDAQGRLVDWWQPSIKKEFLRRVKCIITQYSNYTYKDVSQGLSLNLNGDIGQQENVADNGGLKMAYKAYKSLKLNEDALQGLEKYSNKQMFWISYAHIQCARYQKDYIKNQILTDGHAPNEFRVIGTVSNIPDFASDFHCPQGSKMNPPNKCTVW